MFGFILSPLLANSLFVTFEDANCTNYLSMGDGKWQQVVLRNVGYIELMIMNRTTDYLIYHFPDTKISNFDWDTKAINGHPMELKYSKGDVKVTLDRVTFFCPIKSVSEKKLELPKVTPLLKCRWEDKNVIPTFGCFTLLLLLSLVFGHKLPDAIKALKVLTMNQHYQNPLEQTLSDTTV